MYDSFIGKKHSVEERLSGLNASVAKHERMNRALRVGRMPTIAVAILSRLANAGLDEYFRVVGTRGRHHPQNCEGGVPIRSDFVMRRTTSGWFRPSAQMNW